MPTIAKMRLFLIHQYPNSIHWHEKVQNMPTKQVVAIYQKMMKRNVLPQSSYHQIDMFEYMASLAQNNTEVNV